MQRTLLSSLVICPILALAQAGTLDLSFSDDGLLVSELSFYVDEVHAVIVDDDYKTIGVGWTDDGSTVGTFVHRLLTDGTEDPSFGTGGIRYSLVPGEQRYAYAVGIQSTGNIVVAGLIYDASFDGNAMLLRYLPDGTPDPSFGTNGFISLDYGADFGFQSAWAMEVMDDDRIVLVGEEGENGIACVRLSSEGVPDVSFGTNGLALTGVPFSSGLCLDVQEDGSVIVGGYRLAGDSDWLLARFDPNGVLDPAFGTGGIATLDIGGGDTEFMRGIDVLSDGRIAACGSRSFSGLDDEPIVVLFTSTGDPDPSFGVDGILLLPYAAPQWGQARSLIVQSDDKLLVAGFRAQPGGVANNDFFLLRILEDGTLDPAFAGTGQVHTDVSGSYDRAFSMALAPDGAIVLGGFGTNADRASAYVRYINDIGTGITPAEAHDPALAVFPNPATDRVHISMASDLASPQLARLYNVEGSLIFSDRLVADGSGKGGWLELPSDLNDGTYFIEVRTGEQVQRAEVVVMRE